MPNQEVKVGYDSDLTIRHAADVKSLIAGGLDEASRASLAVNPDAAVDLSFVQLVASARRQASDAGGAITLTEPAGPKLREILQRGGFIEGASPEDLKFWFHSENAQ